MDAIVPATSSSFPGTLAKAVRVCSETNEEISLHYETFGDASNPTILFIAGLGAQLLDWDEEFLRMFSDAGYHCIRFDNRDIGMSTQIDCPEPKLWKFLLPACCCCCCPEKAPYSLDAMAEDAAALLRYLHISKAHIVGQSMGGMIAQIFALAHPEMTLSATLIFTNTGNRSIKDPTFSTQTWLVKQAKSDSFEDQYAFHKDFEAAVLANGKAPPPEQRHPRVERFYRRSTYRKGKPNQAAAIVTAHQRDEELSQLRKIPTLVIHGDTDLLVPLANGKHLADCIPGSKFVVVPEMSHYIGPDQRPILHEAMTAMYAAAAAAAAAGSGSGATLQ